MAPTEELFHLAMDPFEMINRANNPDAAPMLESMRNKYDVELNKWKEQAVPYNDYERFGVLFERTVPSSGRGRVVR